MDDKAAILLEYIRDGLCEQTHFGYVKLLDKSGVIASVGDDSAQVFYQRSCAKPLQASLLFDEGIADFFTLSSEEIAVSCASHTGTPEHTQIIEKYLSKIGCQKTDLLCGIQQPISKTAQAMLIKADAQPDITQNNCSGKHTFMLAACKKLNLDTKTYPSKEHPLQIKIYNKIKELCEAKNELPVTKDGCGVPIWATSLEELGRGYLNLFTDSRYSRLKQAFTNHPYLIGGHERLDSEIINANRNLVAKVGAGGLCVVVNTEKEQALVVKICDADLDARSVVTIKALLQLNWLTPQDIKPDGIGTIYHPIKKTLHNEKVCEALVWFNWSNFV